MRIPPAVRVGLTVAVLGLTGWFVVRGVGAQWGQFRGVAATLRPRWALVVAASALVIGTYAVLVQSWRTLQAGWGAHLPFGTAARIWSVSNLARYIPGTLWTVGAMSVLAERANVPPAAAASAAILNTLINLAAGFVVVAIAGGAFIGHLAPGLPHARLLAAAVGVGAAVSLPVLLPVLTTVAARALRREPPSALPAGTYARAFVANVLAWIGYGVAFGLLAHALLPGAGDNWGGYVAVFTASYLAGFLALLAPSGLVVREAAMVLALTQGGMATAADALVLAAAQRMWLTVLELLPGLGFVLLAGIRRVRRAVPSA